jgi:hypothetical protein
MNSFTPGYINPNLDEWSNLDNRQCDIPAPSDSLEYTGEMSPTTSGCSVSPSHERWSSFNSREYSISASSDFDIDQSGFSASFDSFLCNDKTHIGIGITETSPFVCPPWSYWSYWSPTPSIDISWPRTQDMYCCSPYESPPTYESPNSRSYGWLHDDRTPYYTGLYRRNNMRRHQDRHNVDYEVLYPGCDDDVGILASIPHGRLRRISSKKLAQQMNWHCSNCGDQHGPNISATATSIE